MKTIVAFRSPDLAREFTPEQLRRLDLDLVIVWSTRELLEKLHAGADLCFLDHVLPDGEGAQALHLIRADRKLATLPVVLLGPTGHAGGSDEGWTERVEVPCEPGTLRLVVARLLGVPLRDRDRGAVHVNVFGRRSDEPESRRSYLGTSVDLSERGMAIKSRERWVDKGQRLSLSFRLPGQPLLDGLTGHVVRVNENVYAPELAVAIAFDDVAQEDRARIRHYLGELLAGWPLRWDVDSTADRTVVTLSGALRADSDLAPLGRITGPVDFRLRDLRRIDAEGLQRWVELVRFLSESSTIRALECPVPFVQQAAQNPDVLKGVEPVSFLAPYSCPRCGIEDERLVESAQVTGASDGRKAPAFHCEACGAGMVFDDLAERYFAFLDR